MYEDSTGKPIAIGDKVRWRGQHYTIKAFKKAGGRGATIIEFEETPHIEETPDEFSVDKLDV